MSVFPNFLATPHRVWLNKLFSTIFYFSNIRCYEIVKLIFNATLIYTQTRHNCTFIALFFVFCFVLFL